MATLVAIVSGTSLNLNDQAPFRLLGANGWGGVDVRRVTLRGPEQHGDTDVGYRLSPRDLELEIGFQGTDDATLDGYRDTLTSHFKPLVSVPVLLRYTRDDGAVRQLDCYVRGKVKIDLDKTLRPGHFHRALIPLRAADPAWYNPTQGSVSVVGTALTAAEWWLAGGAIGSAQVAEYGTAPAQGQAWTYTGTPSYDPPNSGYTIAFRSARETITDGKYAFYAGTGMSFSTSGTAHYRLGVLSEPLNQLLGSATMAAGTHNYFISWWMNVGGWERNENFRGTQAFGGNAHVDHNLIGTARRWRSDATNTVGSRWSSALERYAVYVPALGTAQIDALNLYMTIAPASTDAQTLPVAYSGNLPEYPVIEIRGPVSNPAITNLTTGLTLDFGTITIGAGTTYVIDTHPFFKTVLAGTVSKRGELTADSDLGEFRLEPSPVATGGTNVMFLSGTAMGTATRFAMTYYNRYTSF